MKLVVTGGRDYAMSESDFETLAEVLETLKPEEVCVGCARGVDDTVAWFSMSKDIPTNRFIADWESHGKAAGPIRNRYMLDYAGFDAVVLVFPGGKGTADMEKQAIKRGLTILRPEGAE